MSLTSYRAAPPRVNFSSKSALYLGTSLRQLKGPLARPGLPIGGPFGREKIWIFLQRAFCRPGSDLLSRVLRRSTISAGAFHGRVRNGIGCSRSAITTRSAKRTLLEKLFERIAMREVANGEAPILALSQSLSLVFVVPLPFFWSWRLSKRSFARSTDRRRRCAAPT